MKIIRDPVHEYIPVSDEEALLIDTPLIQRLRHISQNGPTRLVYPSLLGTRFEHTLGVAHIASKMLDSILEGPHYPDESFLQGFYRSACEDLHQCLGSGWHSGEQADPPNETIKFFLRKLIRHAAFFHDAGHICLSHTLEKALQVILKRMKAQSPWMASEVKTHELVGVELVRSLSDLPVDPLVKKGALLILLATGDAKVSTQWSKPNGEPRNLARSIFGTLRWILVGDFDADRADYLERDGNLSASGFGSFDLTRLIESLRLIKRTKQPMNRPEYQVLPTVKALSALESTLIERYKLYKWVYFHHKVSLFGELAYRTGLTILEEQCRDNLFAAEIQAETILNLRGRIQSGLTNASLEMPPLLVKPTDSLDGYQTLNPGFFFPLDEMFLDDGWFSARLRRRTNVDRFAALARRALVQRSQVCATLWKEFNGFKQFTEIIPEGHGNGWEAEERSIEAAKIQQFLREPWRQLRSSNADLLPWQEQFCANFENSIRSIPDLEQHKIIPVVQHSDWKLISSLIRLEVIQKSNNVQLLVESSPILKQLSGLPDNVPFFIFFLGDENDILWFKGLEPQGRQSLDRKVRLCLWETLQAMMSSADSKISDPMINSLLATRSSS